MDLEGLLETLVGIDTTAGGSNLALIELVESLLQANDVTAHERVPSPDGTRANLLARIGPDVPGGVVLSAHTDCVPVLGQPWSLDPFTVTRRDGRLYGRGTADMKGFLAVVLAALPAMAAADLARPILLALSYDEELGTVGAPSLVEALLATHARPDSVIVGEPSSMQAVGAHKGVRSFTTTVDGLDGHSSRPDRCANAVAALSRIATFIDDLAAERTAAAADERFDPPHTTVNLATITGGQAINIVPRRAELAWEYRPVPTDDSSAIVDEVARYADEVVLPRLRAATGQGTITFRSDSLARALASEPEGAAETLVRELLDDQEPARTVSFATDGGHFQAAGLSTVVCGPGSIEQAHVADEWVEVTQLETCARFVDDLVERCS